MPNPTRISIRAALVAGAVAASLALAACGGDGDEAEEITITAAGKPGAAKEVDVESIESGEAEITFDNQGKQPDEAQLIRVEGEHSAAEVASALGKVTSGKPFPDWFFAGGGVGATAPGKSLTVTQVLEPGTYWVEGTDDEVGSRARPTLHLWSPSRSPARAVTPSCRRSRRRCRPSSTRSRPRG